MTHTGATQHGSTQAADKNAVRPFHVNVPKAELAELRRRINATKWPERDTVQDQSQGVQLPRHDRLGCDPHSRAWVVLMKRLGYTRFVA